MSISVFPYRKPLPLVDIQKIYLRENVNGEHEIDLHISHDLADRRKSVHVENFIYFTDKKTEVDKALTNPELLMRWIRQDNSKFANIKKYHLYLKEKDFKFKTYRNEQRGKKIYNYVCKKSFTIEKTETLYVLVAAYRKYKNRIQLGHVAKETIIQNGHVALRSNLYKIKKAAPGSGFSGELWTGGVHMHGKTLMAGNVHTEKAHSTLSAEPVKNFKVIDLRFLNTVRRLNFDSLQPKNGRVPVFSPVTLSRNDEGNIHGMFSLDFGRYAQQNTKFGGMMKNMSSQTACVRLDDIRIYSRRVNNGGEGNELTPGTPVHCAARSTTKFEKVGSLNDGVQMVDFSLLAGAGDVLNISFVDRERKDNMAGHIEYKVEVLASDLSEEALIFMRDNLLNLLTAAPRAGLTGWKTLINTYLSYVSFLFGAEPFSRFALSIWKKNFSALVSPLSGDKRNRLLVIEIIEEFTGKLSGLLKVGSAISSRPFDVNSKIYNSKKNQEIRTTHTFQKKYHIKDRKKVGISYLDSLLKNKNSFIPTISFQDMRSRFESEVSKYVVNNPNAIGVNKFGYLSPDYIQLGDDTSIIPTTNLHLDQNEFLGLLRNKFLYREHIALEEQKSAATDKEEILNSVGIGVTRTKVELKKVLEDKKFVTPAVVDSKYYLSPTSDFVRDDGYRTMAISGSTESILRRTKTQENSTFNSHIIDSLVDKTISGFEENTLVVNKNNLQGALSLTKYEENSSITQELNAVSNIINFGSNVKVEYLTSYDLTIGVKQQKWRLLSSQLYEKLLRGNVTLLCRLVPVQESLNFRNLIDLEPMGSLFVLGSPVVRRQMKTYRDVLGILTKTVGDVNRKLGVRKSNDPIALYAKNTPLVLTTPAKKRVQEAPPGPSLRDYRRGYGHGSTRAPSKPRTTTTHVPDRRDTDRPPRRAATTTMSSDGGGGSNY